MMTTTSPRPRVVMKFGGSSVATLDKLRQVAAQVIQRRRDGWDVAVVVSAMGDATDRLLEQAKAVAGDPDRRELDMLLSVGERISMSLLAMAIREAGLDAVSLTGSQSGIITTASHAQARIMEVRPFRVQDELEAGRVVIVAGYQGVSYRREITTLGRGGSDTTAVALAAALDAEACEIYSDVEGVFSADPRVVPAATPLAALTHEEMQELAEAGAKVLNAQAVEFARERGIAIYARKTGASGEGTVVRTHLPKATSGVRGIAHLERVLAVACPSASMAAAGALLDALDAAEIAPRGFAHGGPGGAGSLEMVVALDDLHAPSRLHRAVETHLGAGCVREDLGVVSLVGAGIGRAPALVARAVREASRFGEVARTTTSSFRISLWVESSAVGDVVRALHTSMGLDSPAEVADPG